MARQARELSAAEQILRANVEAAQAAEGGAPDELEAGEEEIGGPLQLVEEQKTRIRLPLIEGGVVIYKGSRKNQNLAFTGRVYVTEQETGELNEKGEKLMYITKECTEEGTQAYDFATHDLRGRIVEMWMTPGQGQKRTVPGSKTVIVGNTLPQELRNRPFKTCEHPEHLRTFLRFRNANKEREFDLLIPPRSRAAFDAYVDRRERSLRIADSQLKETVTS